MDIPCFCRQKILLWNYVTMIQLVQLKIKGIILVTVSVSLSMLYVLMKSWLLLNYFPFRFRIKITLIFFLFSASEFFSHFI